MAPQAKDKNSGGNIQAPPANNLDGETVVISGVSGLFPKSNHIKEFSENLYNKVYMVTDKLRYKHNHPELQQYGGKIPKLEPFDAQFFGVHARLTFCMDSMSRKLLEQTFHAILDAGLNIDHMRQLKLGVFIGSCFSETEKASFYVAENRTGFGIMGCCKAMFANRISYWLDAKGPSMAIDALCSSGIVALELAVEAMERGDCDAAIVGSANICLHPQPSILFGRTLQLTPGGQARSFDKDADGTVRSESINVIVLQKARDAKRIYAEVCHVRSRFNAGDREIYGPLRSVPVMKNFFTNFYEEAKVSPSEVEYIEAFGTSIPEADKNELLAIEEVFCKNRTEPLLVGSVISNMGYSEAASGLCSIIKVCLAYHTGKFAANLHYENPHEEVLALKDGRMRVVTEHEDTRYSYCGINNFSLGGLNAHVLLKGHNKKADKESYKTSMPYLVTVSGRHEAAVQFVTDELKSHPIDPEEVALIHHSHERSTFGHMARGYCILSTNEENETKVLAEKSDYYGDIKRPVWFVYSGMGSQWATMGTELMRIPIFAAAIQRCHTVLEPKGIDIVDIITNPDKTTFDNILNSFVGIAAIQIGLTDVLSELGIVPDKIIGHSVGELGCSYADGCFTAEEMILSAYSRGLVSVETPFIHGSMAAVGLGFNTISKMVPPEIEVACHNSAESSTISGPSDIMKEFVAKLTAQGVFAKEVPCSNIAYHSRYIAEAGPKLKEYLSKVITDPKLRSEKWISTSVPQEKWSQDSAKYSSAEYHTNNLLSPVLFEEIARLIPHNAVTIEIAPHGLLQAILKRSLAAGVTNIAITRRGQSDPITFLLSAIGDMFMVGLTPKLEVLYPKIDYPVSNGTSFLSHLVKWAHTEFWPLPIYAGTIKTIAAQRRFLMSIYDDEYKYIEDHVIEDKIIFPLSALLVVTWETLAMLMEQDKNMPVQFQEVFYHKEAAVYRDQLLRLSITIQKGSGRFEITNENNVLICGYIQSIKSAARKIADEEQPIQDTVDDTLYELNGQDIYKMLFKKGFQYKNEFRNILATDMNFTNAKLAWKDDWVTFIDSVLQLHTLKQNHDGISRPKYIRKLMIDSTLHKQAIIDDVSGPVVKANISNLDNISMCGGVLLEGIDFEHNQPLKVRSVLRKREFMPFYPTGRLDLSTMLNAYLQIVSENITNNTIKVIAVKGKEENISIADIVETVSKELGDANVVLTKITEDDMITDDNDDGAYDLLVCYNIIENNNVYNNMSKILPNKSFVLSVNDSSLKAKEANQSNYTVVASANTSLGKVTLLRWHPKQEQFNVTCLSTDSDCAILKYSRDNLKSNDRLIITTKYPAETGLKDLIGNWSKEKVNNYIQLYMLDNKMISDEDFYEATKKDITFNVYKNGVWGSEFYLPIEKKEKDVQNTRVSLTNEIGNLDSLSWIEVPNLSPNEFIVDVQFAGPNFYDTEKAIGNAPMNGIDQVPAYGMDFSGLSKTGQRVMGVVFNGALSTSVVADPDFLWPVPSHWSLEDAATVPLPYLQALYCLVIQGKVSAGANVLINGGTGALGQAAISIALGIGCKVFTTVSSVEKKRFLRKLFPEIPEERIGNSRDNTFETMVQNGTDGKGCDVTISGLKGHLREASMRCNGFRATYVDVDYQDSSKNVQFGLDNLTKSRSYNPAVLSTLYTVKDAANRKLLQNMLSEGITHGYIRPLSRIVYAPEDVSRAFRLLSSSSHRGRVLLKLDQLSTLPLKPSLWCSPSHSYVVLSSKLEFGIEIADKLVQRGAQKLVLHCEPQLNTGLLRKYVSSWQNNGVTVVIKTDPLKSANNQIALLTESIKMGPVKGIFIVDDYTDSTKQALDKASRKICPQLKYFALVRLNEDSFNTNDKDILADRNNNNLPTLLLHLPTLQKFDAPDVKSDGHRVMQTVQSALSALEAALYHKQALPVVSFGVDDTEFNIINDISLLTGINITDKLPANTKLRDLGVDMEKSEYISTYLEKKLQLLFNRDEVPDLTITQLQHLKSLRRTNIDANKNTSKRDLSMYFTKVDPEEVDSSVDMMQMSTIALQATLRYDEFDNNETYFTVIPGLEGQYPMFERLCERLKVPALVLQQPLENSNQSVHDTAEAYVKILSNIQNRNRFFILGYSYGVLVALEVAALLEKKGQTGVVYCLDSAPEVFPQQLATVIGHLSEQELQDAIVEHMYSIMAGEGLDTLKLQLRNASTWDEKVNLGLRNLCGRVPHSTQYARLLIEAAYGRICTGRTYKADQLLANPLKSQIVLLRGKVPAELEGLPEDFGLSRYSELAPIVYNLDSDHLQMPQDLRCSNIINRHLDSDLLEDFKKRILCDTYLPQAEKFTGSSSTDE